jgi:hypothetical protein
MQHRHASEQPGGQSHESQLGRFSDRRLACLALLFLTPQLAGLHRYVFSAVQVTAVFLLIVIGQRSIDIFFFDQLRRWHHQAPVPVVYCQGYQSQSP